LSVTEFRHETARGITDGTLNWQVVNVLFRTEEPSVKVHHTGNQLAVTVGAGCIRLWSIASQRGFDVRLNLILAVQTDCG
jgi:hypothetical protein